ncbi:hypothetical protein FGG08_001868 [Glutinoglossum americanum]|uniref:Glutamine-dependent NAD(+) synthetase n=1 Tax=Glutinoglossum americanum TaxID=1670608 RepID=A0A9P8IAA1_9PEZI|nr:hypothetical protein FGG08_001868 [Glutinoglossum americanum]
MGRLITVATCNLNQWALDFEGNTNRIIESIKKAKEAGAKFRMLERILKDTECYDILLDIGMPVQHRNIRYNCRITRLNGKILLIRPKMWLENNGNYFELRHLTPFLRPQVHNKYHLPRRNQKPQGAVHVTFGDAVISTPETCIGAETCVGNHENMPHSTTAHHGSNQKKQVAYIYANRRGCDGDWLYYDGCAMILVNGEVVARGSQFSLNGVEVVTVTIDLEEVRAYRSAISRGLQAAMSGAKYDRIQTDFELGSEEDDLDVDRRPSPTMQPRYHSPEEEIALCAGAFLQGYFRRCGAAGYLVPLSGGIDSCATVTMVFSMCRLVIEACEAGNGNEQVIADVKRLAKCTGGSIPTTPQGSCNRLLHTICMGMSKQSPKETRSRAKDLSNALHSYHVDLDIDDVYQAQRNLIISSLNFHPKFKVEGGMNVENLTLQNIQARSRMVTAYESAQILPTTRKRPGGGSLLALGSANVGESLRGYPTKDDCSSVDIVWSLPFSGISHANIAKNPIGNKSDLKRFIAWAEKNFNLPCLHEFLMAVPTAELEPITESARLMAARTTSGRLRKVYKLGPYGVFRRLVHEWGNAQKRGSDDDAPVYNPRQVAEKIKWFFHYCKS